MPFLFANLGKILAILPWIAPLLSPQTWSFISRALAIVTRLVTAFEGDTLLTGREKAIRVFDEAKSLLAEDGYIINSNFDFLINVAIELSLVYLRKPKLEQGEKKKIIIKVTSSPTKTRNV
jgi:hypothetical protein